MALEIALDRSKDHVRRAIMQFAARQGCRVTTPWYLDGFRIEQNGAPAPAEADTIGGTARGILNAAGRLLTDKPKGRVYVDVELSRRRGQTIVLMKFGENATSASIGHALNAYLLDDAAFVTKAPPVCPKCMTPVSNVRASFCGRCGAALTAGGSLLDASSATENGEEGSAGPAGITDESEESR